MRHPTRWRNVGAACVATGVMALASVFVMPRATLDSWVGAVCAGYGVMVIVFGGLLTSWWHKEARAEAALRRGGGLVARWQVDPDTWRRFAELNRTFNLNQQPVGKAERHAPVDVLVGDRAIVVDATVHTLNGERWSGDWSIEQATMGGTEPCCIYLYVSMRGRGGPVHTNLIFPVPDAALREGRLAFESLKQRAEARAANATAR